MSKDLRKWIQDAAAELEQQLTTQLDHDRSQALDDENRRYLSRQGEVSAMIESSTLARLQREIQQLRARRDQGELFDPDQRVEDLERTSLADRKRSSGESATTRK